MPTRAMDRALRILRKRGIVRSREFEGVNVTRAQVQRMVERGLIERVSRGLYTLPGSSLGERQSLVEACSRVPAGVVCLLSALRFHGLTTQNPPEVWMAIARKAWRPVSGDPPLRVVHMADEALRAGVEEHAVGAANVRVFGAAKTVADCFKFRNRIGLDIAVEALRDYRRKQPKGLEALWRNAEVDRVDRVMRPYLEAIG